MAERKHTPTPYAAIYGGEFIVPEEHADRPIGGSIHADNDRDRYALQIAQIPKDDKHGRGTRADNSEFVLRACNSHEDLVAACEYALEALDNETVGNEDAKSLLRAALSRARGEVYEVREPEQPKDRGGQILPRPLEEKSW